MVTTTRNERDQTIDVSNVTRSGLRINYSVPQPGAVVGQRLTIRSGRNTVRLTCSQIKALTRVITTAKRLARS